MSGYPPAGIYRLHLTDGNIIERPMSPDWVWDDTFGGAHIEGFELIEALP